MRTTSRSRHLLLPALLLAAAARTAAADALPSDAAVRAILKERVDSGRSSGLVVGLLDENGRRVVAYGNAGAADKPLDGNSVFEIGSVTKVFTAALLAEMVRRGEVKLEDPVSKYLPETVRMPARGGRQITLLDLATQTSGLPRLPGNLAPKNPGKPYADYTVEHMYEFLSRYELPRDIGEKYEYSNLGMGLLGHALARRAGMGYEELLTKRILVPLDMKDTVITLSAAARARVAPGHDAGGPAVPNWDMPTLPGAGALRSTANDMLKFLAANLDAGAAPLPSALRETHRVRRPTEMPSLDIGLAWHVFHRFGIDLVWHNGGTGGYHSWIGFVAARRAGVVVLSNSSPDIDDIGLHLVESRFPLSQPPRQRKESAAPVPPAVLESYVGEYRLSPSFSITVTREGGSLFLQATGQPRFPLYSESETEFFLKVVDAQITFVREEGRVTGLVLHQSGRDAPGAKVRPPE